MNNHKSISLTLLCFMWLPLSLAAQEVQYLLPLENNFTQISNFSEGLARVVISYDSVRFINTSGEFAFPQSFEEAGSFHSGRAWVRKRVDGKYQYGFINRKGELEIPYRYDEVERFSGNRAVVGKGETWKIIDRKGNVIINFDDVSNYQLTSAHTFQSNRLEVEREDKQGYINAAGEVVVPIKYDVALKFTDGMALVANEIPYEKREGDSKSDKLFNRLKTAQTHKQWMIIDITGTVLYTFKKNERLDWETNLSNGLLLFRTDRFTFGFMNKYGERIIEPIHMSRKPFPYSDGVFIEQVSGQRSDNKDGYMVLRDTTGQIVSKIPFCGEYGCMYDSNHKFHEGLLAVKIQTENGGALWGYINKQGEMVIPPQYSLARDFHGGRAVVKIKNGSLNYIINPLTNGEH